MRAAEESREKVDFYDSWITRDEAIYLTNHKNDSQALKAFLVAKLADEEEVDGDEFRLQIHIDFNLEAFRFCGQAGFSAEQTSALMSIIRHVFRDSLKNRLPTETSFEKLQECLHLYLRDNPPFMRKVFDAGECAQIQRFACHLYKFFMMYEMSMTKFIDFNILSHEPLASLPQDEPLELGRELDGGHLRAETVLGPYLGSMTISAPTPTAKQETVKTPVLDAKVIEEKSTKPTEQPITAKSEGNQEEPLETEETKEVKAIVDQKLGFFKNKFESETLKKADDDMEGYIDKHGKVKKKK